MTGSKSRAGWTPYDGVTVTGWPVGTIVRGKTVMWQGELVTPSVAASRCGFWKHCELATHGLADPIILALPNCIL